MTNTTNIQQDTDVPKGYKKTPLGVIPKEWEVKRVDEFAPLQRGFDLPIDKIIEGKFPVVFSNGILNFHNEFKAKAPGVVTGRSGTIGKVTFVEEDYWPHNTALWVTDFKGNNPKYVYYFYSSFNLIRFGSGSGVPTLNRNDVHLQKIALPPLPEQQKIAEILSTWDMAIEKQNTLIEQLELRKRGLMQQLLTGKLRLRNAEGERFKGEWKKVRLGEVFKLLKGAGLSKDKLEVEGKYPCILYGELYTSYNEIIKEVNSYTNYEEGTKSKKGDILIPSSTTTNGIDLITSSCIAIDDVLIGGDVIILRPKKDVNSEFFSLLFSNALKAKFVKFTQGVTIIHIYGKDIINEKVSLPSFSEQTAIAEVLSTADREIEIEKQKLAALQNQKKGLMLVLLSGRVRVKVSEQ